MRPLYLSKLDIWKTRGTVERKYVQRSPTSGRRFDCQPITFAVGTRVTSRPPHRSVRAQFGHTAPTSGM
jgi:hypothetical protein